MKHERTKWRMSNGDSDNNLLYYCICFSILASFFSFYHVYPPFCVTAPRYHLYSLPAVSILLYMFSMLFCLICSHTQRPILAITKPTAIWFSIDMKQTYTHSGCTSDKENLNMRLSVAIWLRAQPFQLFNHNV